MKPWCLLPETKLSCEVVIKYLLSPLHRLPANSKPGFVAPSSYKSASNIEVYAREMLEKVSRILVLNDPNDIEM